LVKLQGYYILKKVHILAHPASLNISKFSFHNAAFQQIFTKLERKYDADSLQGFVWGCELYLDKTFLS
jgi:hypothetical protein